MVLFCVQSEEPALALCPHPGFSEQPVWFAFVLFFVPPSISGLFFVLVTSYGDGDLAEPPEPYGSSASRTASMWVTTPMSCCHGWSLSAQCLESKFGIGTEQQKQERAQPGRELSQLPQGNHWQGWGHELLTRSCPHYTHTAALPPFDPLPQGTELSAPGAGRAAHAGRGSAP